jgi:hypothetical protein
MQTPVIELVCCVLFGESPYVVAECRLQKQDKVMIEMGICTKIMRGSKATCKFYTYFYAGSRDNVLGFLLCLRR